MTITLIRPKYMPMLTLMTLLFFQNPLEGMFPACSYLDEGTAVLGLVLLLAENPGRLRFSAPSGMQFLSLCAFTFVGLLGNLLFRFQPLGPVLIDLFTNLKFFLALAAGSCLFRRNPQAGKNLASWARTMAAIVFALFLLDITTQCFPTKGERYGLRAIQLFWRHPTYLSGALVFLLGVLTLFYEKANGKWVVTTVIILLMTLRSKAIAAAAVYFFLLLFVMVPRKPLKWYHFLLLVSLLLAVAGRQFAYYYIDLRGQSARSILTETALTIAKDFYPIGTGFGCFGSSQAAKHYSPVYVQYGFRRIPELDGVGPDFFSDTFWPILLGQTGVLGTACYLLALYFLIRRTVSRLKTGDFRAYATGIFLFSYLLISSTSEPAFNNAVAIPIALLLGGLYSRNEGENFP